jgi:EAL domain-containing protein (putative c-di-GMP-specific phosphodiesterase class I)
MSAAKGRGRGAVEVFDERMRARALSRLSLEASLARALDSDELRVVYQPIVDTGTGRLWGLEALLRWEPPHLGPVSPAQFVPIAEDTGMIVPIGDWVLREAAERLAAWRRLPAHEDLRLTVNVSPGQLRSPGLVDRICESLAAVGLPPGSFTIEITESAIIEELELTQQQLRALRAAGVAVSLDDFGTGHSSLIHIRHLPIDLLKIDRSFVAGMLTNRSDRAIVRAVIMLAESLGLRVVAEGVENAAQLREVALLGCRLMQGYLFSKPLATEQVEELLHARSRATPASLVPNETALSAAAGTGPLTGRGDRT